MKFEQLIEHLLSEAEELRKRDGAYIAFMLLTLVIEMLGKCLDPANDWNDSKNSAKQFRNALHELSDLNKYEKYNYHQDENNHDGNYFYSVVRCGLHHSGIPASMSLMLSSQDNDLDNNVIGCAELCRDVRNAFLELKQRNNSKLSEEVLTINEAAGTTGATRETKTVKAKH